MTEKQKTFLFAGILLAVAGTLLILRYGESFAEMISREDEESLYTHEESQNYRKIDFQSIEKAAFSVGYPEKKNYVIKTASAWEDLWKKIYPEELGRPDLFPVDFSRSQVLVVFQGKQNTGGYFIEIKKVAEKDGEIEVQVIETRPGKECIVTLALTYPFHAVIVPKSEKEVTFATTQKTMECR